jgi:hypothetical protein
MSRQTICTCLVRQAAMNVQSTYCCSIWIEIVIIIVRPFVDRVWVFFLGSPPFFGNVIVPTRVIPKKFPKVLCQQGLLTKSVLRISDFGRTKINRNDTSSRRGILFVDNAYSNTHYMVTPFKGKVTEEQDSYNFFHSQLHIQVECAFGKLVHRWGILQRPLSPRFGIRKSGNLVLALCQLHNYCSNRNLPVYITMAADDVVIASASSGMNKVDAPPGKMAQDTPVNAEHNIEGLLNGGEHLDDVSRNVRQQHACTALRLFRDLVADNAAALLPRQVLLRSVVNQGLKRPRPRSW